LVSLERVSPDMSVMAIVCLAVGILLRIRTGDEKRCASLAWAALLGLVLGIGYLAKTAMLPLAFGFLAVIMTGPGRLRRKGLQIGVALVTLLVVAAPFVMAISRAKGHLTFGESGRLNYIWFVNCNAGYGPVHPPRELVRGLGVYEFAGPVGGSVPSWFDPSYWTEGVKPRFDPKQQLKRLVWSANSYYDMFATSPFGACILMCICALLFAGYATGARGGLAKLANEYLPLTLPGVFGLAAYALVLVKSRYVAPFALLLGVAAFSSLRLRDTQRALLVSSVLVASALAFALTTAAVSVRQARMQLPEHPDWQTAEHLSRLGVQHGDKVAVVGWRGYWARIARVRLVVEMQPECQLSHGDRHLEDYVWSFWAADRNTRQRVLDAMAGAGVTAVVADRVPPLVDTTGWIRLGSTDRYVWLVKRKP